MPVTIMKTDPDGHSAVLVGPISNAATAIVTMIGGTAGCDYTDCLAAPDLESEYSHWDFLDTTSFGIDWCADFFAQHGKGNKKQTISQRDLDELAKADRDEPHDPAAAQRARDRQNTKSHQKATGNRRSRHGRGGSSR